MLLTVTSQPIFAQIATQPPGSGTAESPYYINNLENLYWIAASDAVVPYPSQADRWNSHYLQTAPIIDASATFTWFGGSGFPPIGKLFFPFNGTYNGLGYIIGNLTVNSGGDYAGLFGYLGNTGSIENLQLIAITVNGNDRVGSLVGSSSGTVNNCSVMAGNITGSNYVGGLVGFNGNLINNCFTELSTIGASASGALVGQNDGTINNSFSHSVVNGQDNAGGLVGYNNNAANINNCYSTGAVSGSSNSGGLVGFNFFGGINNSFWDIQNSNQGSSSGGGSGLTTLQMQEAGTYLLVGWKWANSVIRNCYCRSNVSNISSIYTSFGGFIGSNSGTLIKNCFSTGNVYLDGFTDKGFAGQSGTGYCFSNFFDNTTSNQLTAIGATALTTAQMKTESTFTDEGWDFTSIWDMNGVDNDGYPFLQMLGIPIINTTEVFNIGSDTAQSGGIFIYEGNSPLIAKGVIWDVSNNPNLTNHLGIRDEGGSPGGFTSTLTGLLDTTIYYVRAYATNSAGIGYGATISFYTILSPREIMIPPGNALDFDGTNDYVSISNESNFDFYFKMTLEAWIKNDAFDKEWQAIITKGDGAWRLERYGTTNHLNFGTTGTIPIDLEGTTNVNDGQWHHIACVMNGLRKYLYVDGQLDATNPIIGDIDRTNDLLYFGENSGNTGRNFDGLIDEVRIWNIDRTAAEIQDNRNIVLTGHENGLVAYYKFDMNSGTYLYDHTGNGNVGRLQNMGNSDWVPAGWGEDKTYTWTGGIDHDWTNPGNWDGVSVPPSSGENAIIPLTVNNPRLETTVEIGGLYIISGASLTIAPMANLLWRGF